MNPRVAVLVPCYKRPEYTALSVGVLLANTTSKDVSVFLADDGSQDETESVLKLFGRYSGVTVCPFRRHLGLTATVARFWVSACDGGFEYAARIDNDCLVDPPGASGDWVEKALRVFEKCPELGLLGLSNRTTGSVAKRPDIGLPYRKGICDATNIARVSSLASVRAKWESYIGHEKDSINAIFGVMAKLRNAGLVQGFSPDIGFESPGQWRGGHRLLIRSQAHANYSKSIRRGIGWKPSEGGIEDGRA